MNTKLARLACLVFSMLSWQVYADEKSWFFKPYAGVDAGVQNLPFDAGYGDFHFNKNYPVTNLNVGVLLHKYIGVEFGYEYKYGNERNQYYQDTALVLGFNGFANAASGDNETFFSNTRMNGFNFNLLLTYPVLEKTDLFAIIGGNQARMHYTTMMIKSATPIVNNTLYWQSNIHTLPRLGLGIRHNITEDFGWRITYLWEKTSKLSASVFPAGYEPTLPSQTASLSSLFTVKPQNSQMIMLGLYCQGDWA